MRIYLRRSVSTDRLFPPVSTFARLSAFIDAHLLSPFGLDRAPIPLLKRLLISFPLHSRLFPPVSIFSPPPASATAKTSRPVPSAKLGDHFGCSWCKIHFCADIFRF
jgi:hypothetical protein